MMLPLKPVIALETVKREKTMAQIVSEFRGQPDQIKQPASSGDASGFFL